MRPLYYTTVTKLFINMKRLAFKMKLNKGQKEAYIKRHNQLWPELKQLLKDNGVNEYSIFLDDETSTLFPFQKVSGEGGSQDLANNDIVKKWWDFMADIMEVNPDNSPISIPLEEVFYSASWQHQLRRQLEFLKRLVRF